MRYALLVVVVAAEVCLCSGAALANSDKQTATYLFKQGNRLFRRGMYFDALKKYKQAKAIYPTPRIDMNIGSTLDAMGKRPQAASYFHRFLMQKGNTPARLVKQAEYYLFKIKRRVGSVKLTCPEESATVKVDGRVVGTTPLALPIYFNPGVHRVEVQKDHVGTFGTHVRLRAGKHISLDAPLRPGEGRFAPATAAAAKGATDAPTTGPRRTKTILAYTSLGLGAALAVGAAVMYGVGFRQGDEAHSAYLRQTDPELIKFHYDDVESAKTKLLVGHVLAGVAVAAIGVSVYAFLTRPDAEAQEQAPARPSASVGLLPGGGAVLTFGGQF